jgi:hypothetical protein
MDLQSTISGAITQSINGIVSSIGSHLAQFLLSASYPITLIGGGILIVLYVGGFRRGLRYTGILFVGFTLIQYLLN